MTIRWYSCITPVGYGIWVVTATVNIFNQLDPVTNLVAVCCGSVVAGFGLFYERRQERLEKLK